MHYVPCGLRALVPQVFRTTCGLVPHLACALLAFVYYVLLVPYVSLALCALVPNVPCVPRARLLYVLLVLVCDLLPYVLCVLVILRSMA